MLKATKRKTSRSPQLSTKSGVISETGISDHVPTVNASLPDREPTLHTPGYNVDAGPDLRLTGGGDGFDSTLPLSLKPSPNDVAMNYFLHQFTSAESGNWNFIRHYALQSEVYPCLDLAMRACGMAALVNVEKVAIGRSYAQVMYMKALGLLNEALRDPNKSRADDSLIGVTVLGYYEASMLMDSCPRGQLTISFRQSHVTT